jgi:PAS domain S-box-containing protein
MDFKSNKDKRFHSFLESVPDAIVIVNKEGNIQSVNSQTETLFGYERSEIIGKKIEYLIPSRFEGVHQGHRNSFFDKPRVRKMGEGMELFAQHKDGNEFPVEISLSKLDSDEGFLVCASIRDVSNQKKIEKELLEAKIKAENAVKSKQQFLSNMSHEIRTPLNSIIGFTKVILKTDLTEKQRKYLTAIKISGDTLIVLVNDILDLAKVDAGKMIFDKAPFRLSSSISAMLHLFEAKMQEKNLKLDVQYDVNIPEVLEGDSTRLHQIIINLVSNAIKFTNKGKITVSVRKLFEDQENVTVGFSVGDTGIGIEKGDLDMIFENFQQAHTTSSKKFGGTGLGLAIVKKLVETQGGSIKVQSEVGKGSVFSFVLNFKKTTREVDFQDDIIQFVESEFKNSKVLIVEDVEFNQLLVKGLLDEFGFVSDIAINGKHAIENLEKETYDVILMDLQMPEMDGFQATTYIRDVLRLKTPIIALTADVSTVDIEKCREVGMDDYISKPINEQILYNKIVAQIKKNIAINGGNVIEMAQNKESVYVNFDFLQKITNSDPKLSNELIAVFLKQTPQLVKIMEDSLVNKDYEKLKAAVHRIVPSLGVIGSSADMESIAKRIQEDVHTLEFSEELQSLVQQLVRACKEICVKLESEFNIKNN